MKDQHLKKVPWLGLALASLASIHSIHLQADTLVEDFATDPLQHGWQVLGDPNLFAWDEVADDVLVTWDSRQTNSYFCRPLGTVLGEDDNFSMAFDLRLTDFTPGIDPTKTSSPFQIAVGLIRMADATSPGFIRGSGFQSPNIVEFDFFPDPGGDWQWGPSLTIGMCDHTGLNWSSGGFAPDGLNTNDVFRISMAYDAASRTLNAGLQRNGAPFLSMPPAVLDTNFTALRVDAVAVCSYSDAGQWPGYEGSILAHGSVDNFLLTLPSPPVGLITGSFGNTGRQVQLLSRTNWLYTLERTTDFASWSNASPTLSGTGTSLILQDTNVPADKAFYRVRAERP